MTKGLSMLLLGSAQALSACGGVPSRPETSGPAPHRHEFLLETRETVTETLAPSFVGPDGRLIPEVIRRYVRGHFGAVFACYERGRKKDPKLTGKITVQYVIGEDGIPRDVVDENTTLPDREVVGCILRMFQNLRYEPNRSGNLAIVYPILLTPPPAGRRADPFFDAHDGLYGYEFAPDSAARIAAAPPPVDIPALGPGGRLFSDAIEAVVHKNFTAIAHCNDKTGVSKWSGTLTVRYVIGEDGVVKAIADEMAPTLDKEVARCVSDVFRRLRYPESHGGSVNVVYHVRFGP